MADDCLFCKIIRGEIPCNKVYEDEHVLAFLDISPINKGHTLIVPKQHVVDFLEMSDDSIIQVFSAGKKVAAAIMKGTGAEGFNLGMNNKKVAGQLVMHTHLHIMPRFEGDGLKLWPGNEYSEGEAEKVRDSIVQNL